MVRRAAVEDLDVDVGARALGEAVEKVVDEIGFEIADAVDLQLEIDDGVDPAAEVDGGNAERLVHRHDEVAGAIDAAAVAERCRHRFAEGDADVLDGVMLIDVEIPLRLETQIEAA